MMIGARLIPLLFPMLAPEAGGESVDTGFTLLLGDPLAEAAAPAELAPPPQDLPEAEEDAAEEEVEALPFWWPDSKLPEAAPKPVIAGAEDIPPTAAPDPEPAPDAPVEQAPEAAPEPEKADPVQMPEPAPKVEAAEPAPPKAPETPQPQPEARVAKPAEPSADVEVKRAVPPPVAAVHHIPDMPAEKDDLGPIQVMFEREGEATRITLVAERPEALDLMRRNADHLQQELQQEGLGDADLNFAERQRDQPQRGPRNAEGADAPIVALPQAGPQSGLDLRL